MALLVFKVLKVLVIRVFCPGYLSSLFPVLYMDKYMEEAVEEARKGLEGGGIQSFQRKGYIRSLYGFLD